MEWSENILLECYDTTPYKVDTFAGWSRQTFISCLPSKTPLGRSDKVSALEKVDCICDMILQVNTDRTKS